jgi:hypothetical protein
MEINWGEVLVGVFTAMALGALNWGWVKFTAKGRAFWSKLGTVELREPGGTLDTPKTAQVVEVSGIKPAFVLALIALFLGAGLLAARLHRAFAGHDLPFNLRPARNIASATPVSWNSHVWEVFAQCKDSETPVTGECHVDPPNADVRLIDAGIQRIQQYGPLTYRCIYSITSGETPKFGAVAYCAVRDQLKINPTQ